MYKKRPFFFYSSHFLSNKNNQNYFNFNYFFYLFRTKQLKKEEKEEEENCFSNEWFAVHLEWMNCFRTNSKVKC